MRNERKVYPDFTTIHDELYFAKELEFWGVPNEQFEEKRLIGKLPVELVNYLLTEPANVKPEPLARWKDLGPMPLLDIMKNSSETNPIIFGDQADFGKAEKSYNFEICGQKEADGKLHGIGRANYKNIIYEGQFKNDKWCGYGRAIFQDGRYHIGFWENDRKNGPGKSVRRIKSKRTQEDGTSGSEIEDLREETEVGVWKNDVLVQKLDVNGNLFAVGDVVPQPALRSGSKPIYANFQ